MNVKKGEGNIFLGASAGSNITTETNNVILLGNNAMAQEGIKNAVGIGSNVNVSIDNSIILGNPGMRVGIGTNLPKSTLEIKSEKPGESGLRFTNLTSASQSVKAGKKFLSVDEEGNLILIEVTKCQKSKMGKCCATDAEIEALKNDNETLRNDLIALKREVELLKSKD